MITSVTIKPLFEEGFHPDSDIPPEHRRTYKIESYPLQAFRVGDTIPTDSYLVVLIGDNGAGKTTFLKKLIAQFFYSKLYTLEESDRAVFFDITHEGERWAVVEYHEREPEQANLGTETERLAAINAETRLSQGQYTMKGVRDILAAHSESVRPVTLLLDQPEDGIAMKRRKELVDIISQHAFGNQRQIFVATHEPLFTQVTDAIVVNLDEHPAAVCRGKDFDLSAYLEY